MGIKRLSSCRCGSDNIIMRETFSVVTIYCQNCGCNIVHSGSREDAIKKWEIMSKIGRVNENK